MDIVVDDSRMVVKGDSLTTQRIEVAGEERPHVASTSKSTVASLLTLLAADGSVVMGVYDLKGKFEEEGQSVITFCPERASRLTRRPGHAAFSGLTLASSMRIFEGG